MPVIGSILGVIIVLLAFCYSRNHNTFQLFYYRALRKQHQVQVDTAFLHATLPPMQMGMPMTLPMGMPPMGPMGMMPPPMYQPPMGPMGPMGPMPMGMGMPPLMPPPMRGHYAGMPPPNNGFFGNVFRRPDFIQPRWQVPPNTVGQEQPSKVRFGEVQAYDPPTPHHSRGYSSGEHAREVYEQPVTEPAGNARYHPEGRPPPADWVPPVPEPGRPLGMPREKREKRGFFRSGRSENGGSPRTERASIWRGLVRKREEAALERQALHPNYM